MYDDDNTEDAPGGGIEESDQERTERERSEKNAALAEVEGQTVFNADEMTLDYGRMRAKDCKHNTCVKMPRPKSGRVEQEIE